MKHGDIIILAGAGAIVAGIGFAYWPCAVVAGGAWLVAVGLYAMAKRGEL